MPRRKGLSRAEAFRPTHVREANRAGSELYSHHSNVRQNEPPSDGAGDAEEGEKAESATISLLNSTATRDMRMARPGGIPAVSSGGVRWD